MVGGRTLKMIFLLLSVFAASTVCALPLTLTCPEQEYVLSGNESDYYFIQGIAKATWAERKKNIDVKGRFLDPGLPRDLKLKTLTMEAASYNDHQGVSIYCNLSDAQGVRVAFVHTNFLLKDIGIKGVVAGCTTQGATTICETMDV